MLREYEGLRLGAVACPFGPVKVRGYGRALRSAPGARAAGGPGFLRREAAQRDLVNHQADALAP